MSKGKNIQKTKEFEEIGLKDFNFSEHPYVYNIHRETGEIKLEKAGREIPLDITNFMNQEFGDTSNVIRPSWDTYELEWLIRHNHTHRRCMELKALLLSGFGYDFQNTKHKNFKKLEKFMKRPNTTFGDTGTKIMVNLQRQKGVFGYGPLLINKAFDVIQMFSAINTKATFIIPNRINGRMATGVRKYIQISKEKYKVEFFPYDGNPKVGRNYMYWIGHKKLSSSYYPEPEYLPVISKIYEDIFVDKNNIDFFKNRAMGDFVVLFSGTKLNTKTKDQVTKGYQENINQFKGIGNQHRTMIMHAPGEKAKIKIVDLSKNEDGQYSKRQQTLESSIARAWGIMPSLISLTKGGSGMGGGSVAIGDLFLQNQIMIRPEQEEFEEDMNLILESLFGFNPEIKFRTIDTNNQKDMAVILTQLVSSGTPLSKKEGRKFIHKHGLMELDDPEVIPDDEDIIVSNVRTQTNLDGDIRPDGDTDANPDDITSIDENKFDDDK